MMSLKHMSSASQAMQSQEALKKLAAIVYCAGGSIDIPMAQIEEAHFIGGGKYGSAHSLLLTPKVQSYMGNGYEVWQGYPFELEVMPNPMSQCLTVYSKPKELSFKEMDFANGSDTTTISILQPEMKYLEHYDYSMPHGITQKEVMGVEKGPALVSSEAHGMGQVDKLMIKLFEHGLSKTKKVKKVSGLDSIHWLFVGGPAHGETRWIKGNVSVTSMAVTEPMIPKGHSIPPGKHPMMMHKQIQYQGHDLVVDGYRYRIGAQTQEDFNTVPMDEFGKYIEEVGLTPYAQY